MGVQTSCLPECCIGDGNEECKVIVQRVWQDDREAEECHDIRLSQPVLLEKKEPIARPACLASSSAANSNVPPEQWALTLRQWLRFLGACMATDAWPGLAEKKGFVTAHDVCAHFVRPWTDGTGSSVSLLMNAGRPLQAKVMIAHSWGGDIVESREAILAWRSANDLPSDVEVWFDLFSQYQAVGDADRGLRTAHELETDLLGRVLRSVNKHRGLTLLHTSTSDPYDRLWCVFELGKAGELGVRTSGTASAQFLELLAEAEHWEVDAASAACTCTLDEDFLRRRIQESGGFARLDGVVLPMRLGMALAWAVGRADQAACRRLLDARASPHLADAMGRTCLHRAAAAGSLPLVEMLVERGADRSARDLEGNCPAHLIPLDTSEKPVRLLEALVSSGEIVGMRNDLGLTPLSRFRAGVQAALPDVDYLAGDAFCLCRSMEDRWPGKAEASYQEPPGGLHRRTVTRKRGPVMSSFRDIRFKGRSVRIHTKRTKSSADIKGEVIALSFDRPWIVTRDAWQRVAEALCVECSVNLHMITYMGVKLGAEKSYEAFCDEVAELIEHLQLRQPLIFVDDSDGLGACVPWKLRTQPSAIVLINPCDFYSEDFVGTERHSAHSSHFSDMRTGCIHKDINALLKRIMGLAYASCQRDKKAIRDKMRETLERVESEWWHMAKRHFLWRPCGKAQILQKLDPIRTIPSLIVCSAQAPAVGAAESFQRFRRRLLPEAEVALVPESKLWWQVEGMKQVESVEAAVVGFAQRILSTSTL